MTAPAGWYPDPTGNPGVRYFDGYRWTTRFRREESVIVPVQTNHALHLLLTVLTFPLCGGWLWVWLFVAIANSGQVRRINV